MIRSVPDLYPDISRKYPLARMESGRFTLPSLRIGIRSNRPEPIELIEAVYRGMMETDRGKQPDAEIYLLAESSSSGDRYLTVDPGYHSYIAPTLDQASAFWGAQLMNNHLFTGPLCFFHGAAARKNRRILLFFGPSRSGKTTLALRLIAEGFEILSDEFIVIDPIAKIIHPFPRSLLVREETAALIPEKIKRDGPAKYFSDHGPTGKPLRRRIIPLPGREPGPVEDIAGIYILKGFSKADISLLPREAGPGAEDYIAAMINKRFLDRGAIEAAVTTIFEILARAPIFGLRQPAGESPAPGRMLLESTRQPPRGRDDLGKIEKRCRQLLTEI